VFITAIQDKMSYMIMIPAIFTVTILLILWFHPMRTRLMEWIIEELLCKKEVMPKT
jgi:Na+/melibiose symporter-like transporter